MQCPKFELKNGKTVQLSRVVLGTGKFYSEQDKSNALEILDEYVRLGGNCIDTGRQYGLSENIIGEWLETRKCRDKVSILTKGGHPSLKQPNKSRLSKQDLCADLEASLSALSTNFVELYALHRDDESMPVSKIMPTLHQFIEDGKVGAIGTSNWTEERISAANDYAKKNKLTEFSFNNPGFSLADCNHPPWPGCVMAEESMLAWHRENAVPLFAWSPQASGFFSGKYSPDDTANREMVEVYYSDSNWSRFQKATKLAEKLTCTPTQVALAYVCNQPFPSFAIIGARTKEHLQQAFEASRISLDNQAMHWLTDQKLITDGVV